jgi:hypothetical protein
MRYPVSALLGSMTMVASAAARADVPDTPAWAANVDQVTGLGVAVLVPDEGDVGVGLELSTRYGFPVGPVVLAPGGRIGGYYLGDRLGGMMLATGRVTLPVGPLAPFLQAGAGAGGLSNPAEAGLGWLAGGGLMIHFGRQLAVGVEVSWQGITGTGFEVLAIGPSLVIGG